MCRSCRSYSKERATAVPIDRRYKDCEVVNGAGAYSDGVDLESMTMRCVLRGISLGVVFGMIVAGCAADGPSVHVTADLSAPKAAAVSFFGAVAAGDTRTARDASI